MKYVLTVQTPAYSVGKECFAIESAFAHHLRDLKSTIGDGFNRFVLMAPQYSSPQYEEMKDGLELIYLEKDGIEFISTHQFSGTGWQFWVRSLMPLWKMAKTLTSKSAVLHSGLSFDPRRPSLAVVNLAAWLNKCPIIFIVDIDFRQDAKRFLSLNRWQQPKYLVNRLVFDPFRVAQIWTAVRYFDLILLKSKTLVRDFGKGQRNVFNFYDTVHSEKQIISQSQLLIQCERLMDRSADFTLCFFGRFAWSKGIDRMIMAVRIARSRGSNVTLKLIGDGPMRAELIKLANDEGVAPYVRFRRPVPYGDTLFRELDEVHLVMAAPLVEDTPRAAFDAMARGLPLLAFDIGYFTDLATEVSAISLASWPDPVALADRIVELERNREELVAMAKAGVAFARKNTQDVWLARRVNWMRKFALGESS